MTGPVLTTSNVVSIIRMILTIPIVVLVMNNGGWVAVALCLLAAWTDWLDGFIARKTGTVSEWGMVVDPLADKVLVGGVMIALFITGRFPFWFVAVVVLRDIVILIGSVIATRKTARVLPSLWSGKVAVSSIALTGIVAMVNDSLLVNMLMVVSCIAMAVSLYDYARRFLNVVGQTTVTPS